jgi:hypothetical protein
METRGAMRIEKPRGRRRGRFAAAILAVSISLAPLSVFAAVGDAVASCASVSAGAVLDVQPGAAAEWTIHNIYFDKNVELQRYDGSNLAQTAQFRGPDWQNFFPAIHVNNANRIRIKNLDAGSAAAICYDGFVTK